MATKSTRTTKTANKPTVKTGRIYVQSTFNNTIISVTDATGGVLSWASAGNQGFKGARKSTPYAAQVAMKSAVDKAKPRGLESVEVFVSGVGSGREQAVRWLANSGLTVTHIQDITPIPHNGCRPKKPRRV